MKSVCPAKRSKRGISPLDESGLRGQEKAACRACVRDPKNPTLWDDLGAAYACREKFQKAEEAFAHACALDPGNVMTWINLAVAKGRQGKHTEAEEAVRAACRLDPDNADFLRSIASSRTLETPDWVKASLDTLTGLRKSCPLLH